MSECQGGSGDSCESFPEASWAQEAAGQVFTLSGRPATQRLVCPESEVKWFPGVTRGLGRDSVSNWEGRGHMQLREAEGGGEQHRAMQPPSLRSYWAEVHLRRAYECPWPSRGIST